MKKRVEVASLEEILFDICNYEDIDSALILAPTEDVGVFIMSYEGDGGVQAPTLREALIKYQVSWFKLTDKLFGDLDTSLGYKNLDWASVLDNPDI